MTEIDPDHARSRLPVQSDLLRKAGCPGRLNLSVRGCQRCNFVVNFPFRYLIG